MFNYKRTVMVDKPRHRLRRTQDKALPRHSKYVFKKQEDPRHDLRYLIAVHQIGALKHNVFVHRLH